MDDSGTLVANPGAVVTYTCLNQDILLMGIPQLTCTSVGDTSAEWSPVNPPTCDLGTGWLIVSCMHDNKELCDTV